MSFQEESHNPLSVIKVFKKVVENEIDMKIKCLILDHGG